jgi:hypothetical protein
MGAERTNPAERLRDWCALLRAGAIGRALRGVLSGGSWLSQMRSRRTSVGRCWKVCASDSNRDSNPTRVCPRHQDPCGRVPRAVDGYGLAWMPCPDLRIKWLGVPNPSGCASITASQERVANVGPLVRIFTVRRLSAVVCSDAGRGQGTAFEDFGEELGGGGEMFLVPGPYAPPQVGEADLQLVAVVAYGGVDVGALVGS